MHQLKLVCKQFKGVYQDHPGLVSRLYLDEAFSVRSLPTCWLAYIEARAQSIFEVVSRKPAGR